MRTPVQLTSHVSAPAILVDGRPAALSWTFHQLFVDPLEGFLFVFRSLFGDRCLCLGLMGLSVLKASDFLVIGSTAPGAFGFLASIACDPRGLVGVDEESIAAALGGAPSELCVVSDDFEGLEIVKPNKKGWVAPGLNILIGEEGGA